MKSNDVVHWRRQFIPKGVPCGSQGLFSIQPSSVTRTFSNPLQFVSNKNCDNYRTREEQRREPRWAATFKKSSNPRRRCSRDAGGGWERTAVEKFGGRWLSSALNSICNQCREIMTPNALQPLRMCGNQSRRAQQVLEHFLIENHFQCQIKSDWQTSKHVKFCVNPPTVGCFKGPKIWTMKLCWLFCGLTHTTICDFNKKLCLRKI